MKKRLFMVAVAAMMTSSVIAQHPEGLIKNDPSFAERAKELVSKMTLEEKVSQTMEVAIAVERLGIPAYNW